MSELEIVPAKDVPVDDILAAVAAAFGHPLSCQWYRWKHVEGPWGPSWGCVAVDDKGVVGVRLLLPWQLRLGSKTATIHRAVEASTVPRVQGRGVFRRLNTALMEQISAFGHWSAMFSTPNKMSRSGYQKLGWNLLPPIRHQYTAKPLLSSRAGRLTGGDLDNLDLVIDTTSSISTAWTSRALRWRIDPGCGRRYEAVSLHNADGPNGMVYRVLDHRRVRVLLPLFSWGVSSERAILATSVARQERALAVLQPTGPGAAAPQRSLGLRRGDSLLAVWDNGVSAQTKWPVMDVRRWSLTMADLESVL